MNTFVSETVAVTSLRPHPRNYKAHPEDQLVHLVASIKANGFYRNVVIARDGTILAGHGVVQAATRMGLDHVPVVRLDIAPDEPRALKVLAGDNEIANLAEVDDRALTEMLKELLHSSEGLEGTGFTAQQLAALAMTTRHAHELNNMDEAAEWTGMPEYTGPPDVFKVVVSFAEEKDREAFMRVLGVTTLSHSEGKTWSIWWPPRKQGQPSGVEFRGGKA